MGADLPIDEPHSCRQGRVSQAEQAENAANFGLQSWLAPSGSKRLHDNDDDSLDCANNNRGRAH